jgi:hypothetical protein
MAETQTQTQETGNSGADTTTTIDQTDTTGGEGTKVQDWSDDWRDKMAGGDPKEAKRLERFASPKEVFKSYRAFETRLSSGELKSILPKDAKPEQVSAWRKENGIPDDIKGYEMPDAVKIEEAVDKQLVEKVLGGLHAQGASKEQAKAALASIFAFRDEVTIQQSEEDANAKRAAEDELRVEWGGNYRANANAMENMLASAPAGVRDWLATARGADGKLLTANPDAIRWFVQTARELNPTGTVVPAGGDQAASITSELGQLREKMKDRKAWNSDPKLQERYMALLGAQEKLKK